MRKKLLAALLCASVLAATSFTTFAEEPENDPSSCEHEIDLSNVSTSYLSGGHSYSTPCKKCETPLLYTGETDAGKTDDNPSNWQVERGEMYNHQIGEDGYCSICSYKEYASIPVVLEDAYCRQINCDSHAFFSHDSGGFMCEYTGTKNSLEEVKKESDSSLWTNDTNPTNPKAPKSHTFDSEDTCTECGFKKIKPTEPPTETPSVPETPVQPQPTQPEITVSQPTATPTPAVNWELINADTSSNETLVVKMAEESAVPANIVSNIATNNSTVHFELSDTTSIAFVGSSMEEDSVSEDAKVNMTSADETSVSKILGSHVENKKYVIMSVSGIKTKGWMAVMEYYGSENAGKTVYLKVASADGTFHTFTYGTVLPNGFVVFKMPVIGFIAYSEI